MGSQEGILETILYATSGLFILMRLHTISYFKVSIRPPTTNVTLCPIIFHQILGGKSESLVRKPDSP